MVSIPECHSLPCLHLAAIPENLSEDSVLELAPPFDDLRTLNINCIQDNFLKE